MTQETRTASPRYANAPGRHGYPARAQGPAPGDQGRTGKATVALPAATGRVREVRGPSVSGWRRHNLLLDRVLSTASEVYAGGGLPAGPASCRARQMLALSLAEMLCEHPGLDRQERRLYWQMLQDQLRYLARRGGGAQPLEILQPRFQGWMARLNSAACHGDLEHVRQDPRRGQEQAGRGPRVQGTAGTHSRSASGGGHPGYRPWEAEEQFLGNIREHWRMPVSGR